MIRAAAITSLVVTLLLALYLPSAFPPARFVAQLRADHQAAAALWGQDAAARLLDAALQTLGSTTAVPHGLAKADAAGGTLDTAVFREMNTVGERLFDNAYFRSIEALMLLAMFRLGAICHALPWLLPFVAVAVGDGQLSRLRKSKEFRRHDPELFALAMTGAIVLACCTFASLLLPVDVPALVWPAAPLASAWLVARAIACFHHRG